MTTSLGALPIVHHLVSSCSCTGICQESSRFCHWTLFWHSGIQQASAAQRTQVSYGEPDIFSCSTPLVLECHAAISITTHFMTSTQVSGDARCHGATCIQCYMLFVMLAHCNTCSWGREASHSCCAHAGYVSCYAVTLAIACRECSSEYMTY